MKSKILPRDGTNKWGSLGAQAREIRAMDSGQLTNLEGQLEYDYFKELQAALREIPVDIVLMTVFPALAWLFEQEPRLAYFTTASGGCLIVFGLGIVSAIPLMYNMVFQLPFLAFGLIVWMMYGQEAPFFASLVEENLLDNYMIHTLVMTLFVGLGIFCFNLFYLNFRRRLTLSGTVGLSLVAALSSFLMGLGLAFFQWFLFSTDLTPFQNVFFAGVLFPVFGAAVGRVLFSDQLTYFGCQFTLVHPDSGWNSSKALKIRTYFITMTRLLLAFPGTLAIINIGSNSSFAISLLTASTIETVMSVAWFFGLKLWLPWLLKRGGAKTDKLAPSEYFSSLRLEQAPASVEKNPGLERMGMTDALKLWLKSLTTNRSQLAVKFALNRRYEERVERILLLSATSVLLVCGSGTTKSSTLVARGLGAYAFEIVVVEPFKACLQLRALQVSQIRPTHNFHEYYAFVSVACMSLSIVFWTRLYFSQYGLPMSF